MRLFTAIAFDEPIKKELGAYMAQLKTQVQARWVKLENFHMTLVFIGEVVPKKSGEIAKTVGDIAKGFQNLNIQTLQTGSFSTAKGRLLYVGTTTTPELLRLVDECQQELRKLGYLIEKRPFKAHITLARDAKWDTQIELPSPPQLIIPVKGITLFESRQTPQGLQYVPIYKAPFET